MNPAPPAFLGCVSQGGIFSGCPLPKRCPGPLRISLCWFSACIMGPSLLWAVNSMGTKGAWGGLRDLVQVLALTFASL